MAKALTDQLNEAIEGLRQWRIGLASETGPIQSRLSWGGEGDTAARYQLKNKKAKKFLQYEKQTFGINLGWTDDSKLETAEKVDRWFFTRRAGKTGPIEYNEPIAIGYGKDPSYVKHEHRTIGINLGWSSNAVFEWRVLGGTPGKAVKAGELVAIYNEAAKEPLIFFDRTAGGDIGWPSSKTWGDQLVSYLTEGLWKDAKGKILGQLGLS